MPRCMQKACKDERRTTSVVQGQAGCGSLIPADLNALSIEFQAYIHEIDTFNPLSRMIFNELKI